MGGGGRAKLTTSASTCRCHYYRMPLGHACGSSERRAARMQRCSAQLQTAAYPTAQSSPPAAPTRRFTRQYLANINVVAAVPVLTIQNSEHADAEHHESVVGSDQVAAGFSITCLPRLQRTHTSRRGSAVQAGARRAFVVGNACFCTRARLHYGGAWFARPHGLFLQHHRWYVPLLLPTRLLPTHYWWLRVVGGGGPLVWWQWVDWVLA